jgi:tetratricopeptide (TPR) repeat protein
MGGGVAVSDFDNDGRLDIFLANHPHGNSVGLGGVEGAYVKGQGVIFQATVPVVPAKEMKLSGTPQSPKSLSDWEKTLLEIRGEKATTAAQKQQSTLADKLIQSLAENGKNFTHLSDNENLTIVVTFRGGKSTAQSGGGVAAGGMMGSLGGKGGMGPLAGGGGMAGPGGGMPMAPSAGTGGIGSPLGGIGPMGSGAPPGATGGEAMTPDRELELLGDLHQKRGNWSDAASAYERALKTAGGAARARELAKKLAEVYLKNGDLEKARKALDATSGKAPRVKVQGEIKEVVAKPAIKLPTRLIISATKKLLDQVGSGKITLADFKKQATFEVLNFDETSAPKK